MDGERPADELNMGRLLRRAPLRTIGLFLGASPTHGGVFQYSDAVLEAIAGYKSAGYATTVLYLDPAWRGLVKAYGVDGILVPRNKWVRALDAMLWRVPVPVAIWRRTLAHVHSITRALMRQSCDLWVFPAQDIWTYLAPVKALGTIHDLMHRYESRFPEVAARGMYRHRERHYHRTCVWASGILVDSPTGRQQVIESYRVDDSKVFVLPYIASKHVRSFDVLEATGRALPPKFFFYPAQFWEHKNHGTLVEAIAKIRERHPDIRIVFVGSQKNGYASLRARITALGLDEHVVFLDYVSDAEMPAIYHRARAMVMPTFFGPTNIPQLEAFELGCPVATSRIYGIPEQVGDAALLFDPNSVDEIADALERLWVDDDLCATLVARGRKRAACWGPVQFADALLEVIEQLAGE